MNIGDYVTLPNGDRGFLLEQRGEMALVLGDWDWPLPVAVKVPNLRTAEAEAWTAADAEETKAQAVEVLKHSGVPAVKTFARRTLRMMASTAAGVDMSRWCGQHNPEDALFAVFTNLSTISAALELDARSTESVAASIAYIAGNVAGAVKRAAEPGWAVANKARGILANVAPLLGIADVPTETIGAAKMVAARVREMAALVEQAGKNDAHAEMTERALTDEGKALDDALREIEQLRRILDGAHAHSQAYEDERDNIRDALQRTCLALGLDGDASTLDMANAIAAHAEAHPDSSPTTPAPPMEDESAGDFGDTVVVEMGGGSPHVDVRVWERDDKGYGEPRASVTVLVNGKRVGGGRVGGEPEDNTIGRNYAWVPDTIGAVARACGATVTEDWQMGEDDDEDDDELPTLESDLREAKAETFHDTTPRPRFTVNGSTWEGGKNVTLEVVTSDDGPPGSGPDSAAIAATGVAAWAETDSVCKTCVTVMDGPHKGKTAQILGPSKQATYVRVKFLANGHEDDVRREFIDPQSMLLDATEKVSRKARSEGATEEQVEKVFDVLCGNPKARSLIVTLACLDDAIVGSALRQLRAAGRAKVEGHGNGAKWQTT